MKKGIKTFLLIIGLTSLLFLILGGSFIYVTKYRYTIVGNEISPNERCQITFQMKGQPEFPFGATYGRIIAKYDGEIIKKIDIVIFDDGATLRKDNWNIGWYPAGVEITLMGSEQENQILQVLYDGSEDFTGYSETQIVKEIKNRYGNIYIIEKKEDLYCFDTGEFQFNVQNDLTMSDNYSSEYYRYLTDTYFAGRNRAHRFEENSIGIKKTYTPVISLHSSDSEEKEWFCSDITNWLLYSLKSLPYEGNELIYTAIEIDYGKEKYTYNLKNLQTLSEEYTADVYNDLYDFLEEKLSKAYEDSRAEAGKTVVDVESTELPEETLQYYLSLEPDCVYKTVDGIEYRMVPADRACGSSYYAMVVTADGGNSCSMANRDPYNGSGGASKWITFLEESNIGFSCLAYSGGAYGSLYRTEDGGKSFVEIEYPSAKVKLSDGTYYNPFVMPEKIYKKGEKLYLEIGQGQDGDYYGENGFCIGLYESDDLGKTWRYVKEVPLDGSN